MTLLLDMTEVKKAVWQRFNKNEVKTVFIFSPGYAALTESLQFVYTMVTKVSEGLFDVIIPAQNIAVDHNSYYKLRSELPDVLPDTSNVI